MDESIRASGGADVRAAKSDTTKGEEWRPVPGWEHYEASSLGRIRSKDRIGRCGTYMRRYRGRVLRPRVAGKDANQLAVTLCDDGVKAQVAVRRIVAAAFLSMTLSGDDVVYHINGDRRDCAVDNLRVGRRLDVAVHKIARGAQPIGESCHNAKLTRHDVREIIDLLADGCMSHSAIAERYSVSPSTVGLIGRGDRWGYVEYGHRYARADIGGRR